MPACGDIRVKFLTTSVDYATVSGSLLAVLCSGAVKQSGMARVVSPLNQHALEEQPESWKRNLFSRPQPACLHCKEFYWAILVKAHGHRASDLQVDDFGWLVFFSFADVVKRARAHWVLFLNGSKIT